VASEGRREHVSGEPLSSPAVAAKQESPKKQDRGVGNDPHPGLSNEGHKSRDLQGRLRGIVGKEEGLSRKKSYHTLRDRRISLLGYSA